MQAPTYRAARVSVSRSFGQIVTVKIESENLGCSMISTHAKGQVAPEEDPTRSVPAS